MANKIWQTNKSNQLHPLIESYTVGIDYILDQELLGYDIKASKAHANMLHSIEIINDEEIAKLIKSLDKLYDEWLSGKFTIKKEYEDGHTAIETYLTEQLGDIGKKIHTARSRNDQALVMMRLYMKDKLPKASESIDEVITALQAAAEKASNIPMPGYTHMQKAMPTTVASWLNSYADAFTDTKTIINSTLMTIDQNPLGSAAGFGVDININREHTTKALGFNKTQQNPLYCGLSRGLFELIAIQSLNPVITLAGKFANDMMLFTTEEYNFFSLPESFTTGSSIMPHKHNYDLFEI
ncbi:MAG: lyase family protein, partial [Candidatus Saccharimonadales bacterium]